MSVEQWKISCKYGGDSFCIDLKFWTAVWNLQRSIKEENLEWNDNDNFFTNFVSLAVVEHYAMSQ